MTRQMIICICVIVVWRLLAAAAAASVQEVIILVFMLTRKLWQAQQTVASDPTIACVMQNCKRSTALFTHENNGNYFVI